MTEKIVGNDRYKYKFIPNWSKGLPKKSWPTAVAVDSKDMVYITQPQDLWDKEQEKDAPLMFICDPEGNLINTWGSGACVHTHGLFIGADDSVYLCDKDTSKAMIYTSDGKIIRVIGEHNVHSETGCIDKCTPVPTPAGPFNFPTKLVPSAWGDLYASDGYKNSRVHRFHSNGQHIQSWGSYGRGHGQFDLPHSVLTTPDSKVYVCDRFGHKVHVFDRNGALLNVWDGARRPSDMAILPDGNFVCCEHPTDYYYLDELDYSIPFYVRIFDKEGNVLASLETGLAHGIAVDSRGDIYLANHHTVNKCVRLD
jgi:sugar lactone lactonase YvrE